MTQVLQDNENKFWKDKRVLITGGTQGLGKALTERLASAGAIVTIVARTESDLDKMRSDRIYTIPADMGNKEDIHRISGQAIGMMEGIDVLINNASYLGKVPLKELLDTECEEIEEILQVNLLGPFRLIKAVIPYMKFSGGGLIVNISSDAAVNPYPTWGGYSISKTALDHLTAIWSKELENQPISIISLDPGDMNTQMHLDAIPDANTEELYQPDEVATGLFNFLGRDEFDKPRYSASEWRNAM